MKTSTKRWIIVGVAAMAVAGALAFAGVVIASQVSAPPDVAALDAAIRTAPMIPLAQIGAGNGEKSRGVYAQIAAGQLCVWDAPSSRSQLKQGGCDSLDNPLGGHLLSASLAYDGGPATAAVTDARLSGIADRSVSSLKVLMSNGTRLDIPLREVDIAGASYWAFGLRFNRIVFRQGVEPRAVLALDSSGKEIDRQPTGFGS